MKNDDFKQAVILLKAGRRDEALGFLKRYLKEHARDADGWYLLGIALQDRNKKVQALKRALHIAPDHLRSIQLLQKLEEMSPNEQPAAHQLSDSNKNVASGKKSKPSSRNLRWLLGCSGSALLFVVVGALGWVIRDNIQEMSRLSVPSSTSTVNGLPAVTDTPAFIQVMPATWTATLPVLPTETPLPSPTPTPTSTPTVLPLAPAVQAEIDNIQLEVSMIRELDIREEVYSELMPIIKLRIMLTDLFIDAEMLAGLDDEEIILSAFGFMDDEYDLTEAALEDFADYIGGFYLPESNSLYVIGTNFTGNVQYVYSHEYMHALQDQHFDLMSLGYYPKCIKSKQECLAARALVEGEASYVENLWWGNFAGYDDYRSFRTFKPPSPLFSRDPAPPYFGMDGAFAYSVGAYFVSYIHQAHGWDMVNAAYLERLPITTEQILYPEKYIENELPIPVDAPELGDVLGDGWRLVERESMGMWESFLLLGFGNSEASQLSTDLAFAAVEGWGGDIYQVYYHDERQETVLVVNWIWDSQEDQALFSESLSWSLAGRFGREDYDESETCWQNAEWNSCIYGSNSETLWVISSSSEYTELVKSVFPQFP